jgi:hypothetical protein
MTVTVEEFTKNFTPEERAKVAARTAELIEEVIAGHAEYLTDLSKGVAAEEVLSRIKARRAADNAE